MRFAAEAADEAGRGQGDADAVDLEGPGRIGRDRGEHAGAQVRDEVRQVDPHARADCGDGLVERSRRLRIEFGDAFAGQVPERARIGAARERGERRGRNATDRRQRIRRQQVPGAVAFAAGPERPMPEDAVAVGADDAPERADGIRAGEIEQERNLPERFEEVGVHGQRIDRRGVFEQIGQAREPPRDAVARTIDGAGLEVDGSVERAELSRHFVERRGVLRGGERRRERE